MIDEDSDYDYILHLRYDLYIKEKHKYKIAIVAGGTGGHIFPAISLAEQLILEKKKSFIFVR